MRCALQRITSPIGVSTHQLPKELEESLPTVEALEQELKTVDVEEEEEPTEQEQRSGIDCAEAVRQQ